MFEGSKRMIGSVFIVVDNISLFNMMLPKKVQEAVQDKAAAEQKALAAVYLVQKEKRELERKMEEVKGLKLYSDMVAGIPRSVLIWKGIEATLELSKSPNSKIIVMGSRDNLPLMLGNVPDLVDK